MNKYGVLLLTVILVTALDGVGYASSWSLPIGGIDNDVANSVQQTVDGGYIVAGQFASGDAWVLKLNADSSVAWQKTYGGMSMDSAGSIQQTTDGGYIVAGTTYTPAGGYDAWVLKLNTDGSVAWQKTYGGTGSDEADSIQQTADGGYIVAGSTTAYGTSNTKIWVLKLNTDGSVAWQKTYGGAQGDIANSIQQTADGGYIVAGWTSSYGAGNGDALVLKLNADGSVAWQKTYGGADGDIAYSVQQTVDGGFIVAGATRSFSAGNSAWVLKLNADGSVEWQKAYGGSGGPSVNYAASSIQQTADGGYIVAGSFNYYGMIDALIFKLNADGSVAWQKTYGGISSDSASSIQQTTDGGYIVAGYTSSFGAGSADAWVLKLDKNGGIMGCNNVTIAASSASTLVTSAIPVNTTIVPSTATYVALSSTATVSNSTAAVATNCSYTPSPLKWQRTFGGSGFDIANSVQQTTDGGYIVAGTTASFGAGGGDFWVLKLDADGSVTWQYTYGEASYDVAYSIQQTADGGYIVAGRTSSFGTVGGDAWVMKLDSFGSVAWQYTYGSNGLDEARSIQQTTDGGYIVAGLTASFGAGGYDAWVLKLNADGSIAWENTYGGNNDDNANSIQQTADGGYIVAGRTYSLSTVSYDAWVLKLNADGSIAWQKSYGDIGTDEAKSIQQTADGGYIVAGITDSFGAGNGDAWVLKLNAYGSVVWQNTYGGINVDEARSVQQTADGGYIVAGGTSSFGASSDAWVLKLNVDGSIVWQNTYGGAGYADIANAIQQTADGGYIVAGQTGLGAGSYDALVMKLDQNGGITGCIGTITPSTAVAQMSAGAVSSTTVLATGSGATVGLTMAMASATSVVPALICSASYNQYLLNVAIVGWGTGRVTSLPSGLNCTTDCSYPFSSGTVTLSATPDHLASFTGWTGACNSSGQVTMNADKICIATFNTPADFFGTPRFGSVPFLVNFNDLSTNNPTLWSWDFGDTGTASGSTNSHIYRSPGIYTVALTTTGTGGAARARKVDYITAAPCQNNAVRITGPQYYASVTTAYEHLGSSGSIDLQAMEFNEAVVMSLPKTVSLTGGYPCDYGLRIADSGIRGSLTIGGSSGPVSINGITLY
jgi:uncharacterized delta-60 repeat protein